MGFDLNETYDPRFPYGFELMFDNEHFVWDIDEEEGNYAHHDRGEPSIDANVGKNDERCGFDGLIVSPPRVDDERIDCSDEEDEVGDEDANESRRLVLDIENRLSLGAKLESLDQAYLLYCEYARLIGFSVKKGNQKYYSTTQKVCKKDYNCSCEGKSNSKPGNDRLPHFKKQDFRTNCCAMLKVFCGRDGQCTVGKFVKEHNHLLCDPHSSYVLRSSRRMSHAKKSLIEALHSARIRVGDACRFMEKEAGGPENTGFTRRDAYNHMDGHKKKSRLDPSDSNALVKYFMEMSNKEHDFYWNIQTDDDGRLLNFFFRDSRSANDYEFFGDVLSVDTTYKTNKYELICVPFVGVNHHMKNCLFGLAFLSDETCPTFEWLFSSFLESMHGKEPEVVFSDQCAALMNAIDSQFKSSSHRLCQWHINQNAPSHFGSLNGNKEFKALWFRVMNACETVDEFESTWNKMLVDYHLAENRWFHTMYNLRVRWACVFTQERFCAGLHATSRSEVSNKVLKDISSSSAGLYEFVLKYQQIQHDWRRAEAEDDTASLGVPGLIVSNNYLLKQAANYLTRRVFMSFEYEATHSLNVDIVQEHTCHERGCLVKFHLQDCDTPSRLRRVTYNRVTSEATCTCCLWQTVGVICSHIFKIFYHHNVKVIPSKYLLRRLSRDAKSRRPCHVLSEAESSSRVDNPLADIALNSYVMRSTYAMLTEIRMDSTMKAHLVKGIERLRDELLNMVKEGDNRGRREPATNYKNAVERPACRDPVIPQNRRFTTTRLSRHWEKKRPKAKNKGKEESGARLKNQIPTRSAASPSTSNTNDAGGHAFMFSSPRGGCTFHRETPNFFATQ